MSRWHYSSSGDMGCGTCLVYLVIVVLALWIGGECVNYVLSVWFDKTLPLWQAMIVALFLGELPIPAAVITWVLVAIGVAG